MTTVNKKQTIKYFLTTSMTTTPNQPNFETAPKPVSVFHVGDHKLSEEYIIGDHRYFEWYATERDHLMRDIAGWGELPFEQVQHGQANARIELPMSLRNAASVLTGREAWEGEKASVVDFMVQYARTVKSTFNAVDVSMVLDNVGVSRRGELKIVTPPYKLTDDPFEINTWMDRLRGDMEALLANEPTQDDLLRQFDEGMSFLGGTGNEPQ